MIDWVMRAEGMSSRSRARNAEAATWCRWPRSAAGPPPKKMHGAETAAAVRATRSMTSRCSKIVVNYYHETLKNSPDSRSNIS